MCAGRRDISIDILLNLFMIDGCLLKISWNCSGGNLWKIFLFTFTFKWGFQRILWLFYSFIAENLHEKMANKTLLRVRWESVESLLRVCWESAESPLRFRWESAESLLRVCWDSTENLLRVCWESAESLLRVCWDSAENPLRICWDSAGSLLRLF